MIFSVKIDNKTYEIDIEKPRNISIPLNFNGIQPNAYDVEKASSTACEAGELVGDTRRGGSCNFEQITFIPHCNGTHTECVGHITHERISIHDCLKDAFIPASLVTVSPQNASETDETYAAELNENDKLITRKALESRKRKAESGKFNKEVSENNVADFCKGLIIRTLPNSESKLSTTYLEEIPPFFSNEAMEFIGELGVNHLLVDLPPIDRIFDDGKLSNHRIFWKVEQGSFEINEGSLINNTITELCYIPDEIKDGFYLLNLQIAPFSSDASPSRPILFNLSREINRDEEADRHG